MLILKLIIINAVLIALHIVFIKDVLKTINDVSKALRYFIEKNSGFFKILFILIFLFEQIIFIYVLNRYFDIPKWANAFIAIFALIVVTTASIQALIWENKHKYAKQEITESGIHIDRLLSDVDELIDENEKFQKRLEKKR